MIRSNRSNQPERWECYREILSLKDGGEVALDWTVDNSWQTSPIVIILPGLTGASTAEYVKCLVCAAKTIGVRCVIFNNRGLGGIGLKVYINSGR